MSERFARMFERLTARNEAAFVPFVTLGDPGAELSQDILRTLAGSGADALELGIPFSDPCADGPVIQQANKRALTAGSTTDSCLELIAGVRAEFAQLPISVLVYANLVRARGLERFYADAAAAGVDAVLVPDVPLALISHPGADFRQAARTHGICPVLIAPPNATPQRLADIARTGEGYTYVVSRYGITGDAQRAGAPREVIDQLHACNAPPCLLGFGISGISDVRHAIEEGNADGVIIGSRIVRMVGEQAGTPPQLLSSIAAYVRDMKAATIRC